MGLREGLLWYMSPLPTLEQKISEGIRRYCMKYGDMPTLVEGAEGEIPTEGMTVDGVRVMPSIAIRQGYILVGVEHE
jgi:hypothetical protein